MSFKNIFGDFNILNRCRNYGLPIWQCPQFLFLVMSIIIIVGLSIVNLALTRNYIESPEVVALMTLILTAVSLVITFVTTHVLEKLASVSRMKSEFVSIVSHQLRAPLSNLKWSADLLTSGRLGKIEEKQIEYFRIIKENSARMNELISDLLVVSRMETTGFFSHKEPFSLVKLVRESIDAFRIVADSSNIKISLDCPDNLPNILANQEYIKVVFENFLDNAIRYIKEGGSVDIRIKANKDKVYLEVNDNGVGIPKEDQKNIFQKFFRARNAMKYQTRGSGLGLYIAKTMIENSDGKIGFSSQEDKGSTFWFTLPMDHKS